jgi:putative ABC transport system permease protein
MRWYQRFFRRGLTEKHLDAELRFHLDQQIADYVAAGMTPEEASRRARLEFGGLDQAKEECRDVGASHFFEILIQDLRYGLRLLARSPGFAVVALLTLALGIGLNTSIFSVVDGLFLRSLPAENPDQLVWMYGMRQGQIVSASYPDYLDLCRQDVVFSGIIAVSRRVALLNTGGEIEIIRADVVSENYFSMLGINAALGRTFVAGEDWSGHKAPPVVIGHGLWLRRFGGDPSVVGRTAVFNGVHAVILGVAPQWFGGLDRGNAADVWLPANAWPGYDDLKSRGDRAFDLLGRLRPGVSVEKVRAELDTIARRLSDAFPATDKGLTFLVEAEAERLQRSIAPVVLLLGGVGLVLLICCGNISGMMLARAEARQREIAVRLALGAGRGRLLRQLLTESMMLALLGAGLGLLLTAALLRLQPALLPPGPFVTPYDFRVDARALAYTLAVSLLAALISGLAPAFQASRTDLVSTLRAGQGRTERGRLWLGGRNLLVAGEVALSLTLLIVAGLFLESLIFSEEINPGFDTHKKMLIVSLNPSVGRAASNREFFLPAIEKIRSLPGVKGATYAFRMLLSGSGGGVSCEVSIPGVEPPSVQKGFIIKFNSVGRDYFQTVGARILRGRAFDAQEESPTHRSVLINESMARRFWPDTDPVGRHLVVEGNDYEIIGLVQDGTINDIHEPLEPYIYFPFAQKPMGEASIIVETAGDPRQLVGPIKQDIRSVGKSVTFYSTETLKELMAGELWSDRMFFLFVGGLACLGIFLAGVGLYGVVAYLVGRRRHEIGIRMALGARRQDVLRLVLQQGLRPALVGIPVGLGAALVIGRLLSAKLYGVRPVSPAAFLGSCLLVLVITLLASYIPARRATKVDPMVALRYE